MVRHYTVSDDIADKINRDSLKVDFQYDLVVNNEKSTDKEIVGKYSKNYSMNNTQLSTMQSYTN